MKYHATLRKSTVNNRVKHTVNNRSPNNIFAVSGLCACGSVIFLFVNRYPHQLSLITNEHSVHLNERNAFQHLVLLRLFPCLEISVQ